MTATCDASADHTADYYEMCDSPHVEITNSPIVEFTETGIRTEEMHREFDIIALCTGVSIYLHDANMSIALTTSVRRCYWRAQDYGYQRQRWD